MGLRDLLSHAVPYRARLALIALSTILASMATLAIPWLAGQMIGGALVAEQDSHSQLIVLLIGTLVLVAVFNAATALISAATASRVLADLRQRVFSHIISLPMTFHDQGRQGDTLALMTYEISLLSHFLTGTLATLPATLITTLGAVAMLFWLDPALALVVPVLVPAFYLSLKIIGRKLRSLAVLRQKAEASIIASAEEQLEMLPAIKAFTREQIESSHYASLVEEAQSLSIRESRIYAVLGPLIGLISAIAAVLLASTVSHKVAAGALSPDAMFSFLLYAALLTRPVATLANVYGQAQTARGTLARLQEVLDKQPEPRNADSLGLKRARGSIKFQGITFSYPERDQTLSGVSIRIDAGQVVALVGANGAGKSTLVSLLLRFYEPDEGTILLDGEDIASISLPYLRRQIGYVPQRPLLFNGTIRANIAFGLSGANHEQIRKAAERAQADEFIMTLPQGYDTTIGDHGVRLSGGQRQRIALARALLKDPPILVLDEATSMYDLEGEIAFVESCKTALEGRTVIIITHRPASLALANRIVHFAKGRALEGQSISKSAVATVS